jgi:hypothetical protein
MEAYIWFFLFELLPCDNCIMISRTRRANGSHCFSLSHSSRVAHRRHRGDSPSAAAQTPPASSRCRYRWLLPAAGPVAAGFCRGGGGPRCLRSWGVLRSAGAARGRLALLGVRRPELGASKNWDGRPGGLDRLFQQGGVVSTAGLGVGDLGIHRPDLAVAVGARAVPSRLRARVSL